jgi:hypothetical protein
MAVDNQNRRLHDPDRYPTEACSIAALTQTEQPSDNIKRFVGCNPPQQVNDVQQFDVGRPSFHKFFQDTCATIE